MKRIRSSLIAATLVASGVGGLAVTTVTATPAEAAGLCTSRAWTYGSSHDCVYFLQRYLRHLGYYKATPDGSYGGHTLHAVEEWQTAQRIKSDGAFGPVSQQTMRAQIDYYKALNARYGHTQWRDLAIAYGQVFFAA